MGVIYRCYKLKNGVVYNILSSRTISVIYPGLESRENMEEGKGEKERKEERSTKATSSLTSSLFHNTQNSIFMMEACVYLCFGESHHFSRTHYLQYHEQYPTEVHYISRQIDEYNTSVVLMQCAHAENLLKFNNISEKKMHYFCHKYRFCAACQCHDIFVASKIAFECRCIIFQAQNVQCSDSQQDVKVKYGSYLESISLETGRNWHEYQGMICNMCKLLFRVKDCVWT